MLTNILRNLSLGRMARPTPRPYGKMGSSLLLPALAYFGWKYRDRIKSFVQERMGGMTRSDATSNTTAPNNGSF